MLPRHSLKRCSICRYIARLGKGSISVYELPDMGLLDKKSIKLEGVHEFAWSPSQPILCAYQTEQAGGNLPARISLIGFPEKTELRQKNLFSVSGDHLLARKLVFLQSVRLYSSVAGRAESSTVSCVRTISLRLRARALSAPDTWILCLQCSVRPC